jgi:hypothetical protein
MPEVRSDSNGALNQEGAVYKKRELSRVSGKESSKAKRDIADTRLDGVTSEW